jgi:hypothetical protein
MAQVLRSPHGEDSWQMPERPSDEAVPDCYDLRPHRLHSIDCGDILSYGWPVNYWFRLIESQALFEALLSPIRAHGPSRCEMRVHSV